MQNSRLDNLKTNFLKWNSNTYNPGISVCLVCSYEDYSRYSINGHPLIEEPKFIIRSTFIRDVLVETVEIKTLGPDHDKNWNLRVLRKLRLGYFETV